MNDFVSSNWEYYKESESNICMMLSSRNVHTYKYPPRMSQSVILCTNNNELSSLIAEGIKWSYEKFSFFTKRPPSGKNKSQDRNFCHPQVSIAKAHVYTKFQVFRVNNEKMCSHF